MRPWVPLLALCLAVPAAALDPGGEAVGFRGGVAVPGGRLSDSAKTGFSFGGEIRHQLTSPLSLGLDAEYLGLSDRQVGGTSIRTGGDVFCGGAFARWDFKREGRTRLPFLILGGAFSRVSTRAEGPGVPENHKVEWHPGVVAGAGVEWPWSHRFAIGVSGRYRSLGDAGYAATGDLQLSFSLAPRGSTPPEKK